MKKFLVILLTSCYLLSIAGVAVSFHFCCNVLSSVEVYSAKSTGCSSMKEEKTGCCKSDYKFFQLKSFHKAASGFLCPLKMAIAHFSIPSFYRLRAPQFATAVGFPTWHSPPDASPVPAYISHCNFRI